MSPFPVDGSAEVPLTGCDAFFLALEDLMAAGGQGRHTGLTVVELGEGFDITALRDAVRRFSLSHPLLHAKLCRSWFLGVPFWKTPEKLSPDAVPVLEQPRETDRDAYCQKLLESGGGHFLEIHTLSFGQKTTLIAKWSHLLFDGRGAELALQEIARLAQNPDESPAPAASWGVPFPPPPGLIARWIGTRAFVQRHYEMKPADFRSLGGPNPGSGAAAFRVLRFSHEESLLLRERAMRLTGGIFQMPYFFAAAARAHAAVFEARGERPASFSSPVPVQARKPKARHPIFQNQVTVLHFKLPASHISDLEKSTALIQAQFEEAVRGGLESSAATMLWWMRRLPTGLYRGFLQKDTGGEIVSFFQSHTGDFLPGLRDICEASIENGWHIPSVSQPPGSGIFFSEHEGRLSATISWREGSLGKSEVDTMESSLRSDLLGLAN
jgi:hypothetical protein